MSNFEELTKNIDWNRALLTVIPLLQPFIIFGAWLTFARMNTKASIVSKFIAIAEPIPTLDLNLPKEIVLASLFDFTEDFIEIVNKIIANTIDLPANVKDDIQHDINLLQERAREKAEKATDPIKQFVDAVDLFIRTGKTKPERRES
jgi:hypothetical protein